MNRFTNIGQGALWVLAEQTLGDLNLIQRQGATKAEIGEPLPFGLRIERDLSFSSEIPLSRWVSIAALSWPSGLRTNIAVHI